MVGILVHGDNHFIVRGQLPRVCKAGLMVVISSVPPMLRFQKLFGLCACEDP
jgi:hypothetical protein